MSTELRKCLASIDHIDVTTMVVFNDLAQIIQTPIPSDAICDEDEMSGWILHLEDFQNVSENIGQLATSCLVPFCLDHDLGPFTPWNHEIGFGLFPFSIHEIRASGVG